MGIRLNEDMDSGWIGPLSFEDKMQLDVRGKTCGYMVLRREVLVEEGQPPHSAFHFQGFFVDEPGITGEQLATQACIDETFVIIGPLPVNVSLPYERIDWPHWYPYRKTEALE